MHIKCQFNIGTIQNRLVMYKEAYQHAVWLVTHANCREQVNYFYDYTEQYFHSMVSGNIYKNVFQTYVELIERAGNIKDTILEIVNTLDKCNYNFNKVSEQLFVHKNTVFFRLDKIKEFLEIDPVKNACDRHF